MKKITFENYKSDKYYMRVAGAVDALLARDDVVTPIDVFIAMNLLDRAAVEDWRRGRVPFLEKVIHCNLAVAGRILRILRMHVSTRSLRPSLTVYQRRGRGPATRLRFSKSGDPNVEEAYARHFVRLVPRIEDPDRAPQRE